MSLHAHLDALYLKHASLDEQIHDAYAHHQDDQVAALKKKRLVIKDEINELVSQRRLRKAG